jgi:DNA-binding CsgD family transcriptional regulator
MGTAERGLAARRELDWLCAQGIGWAELADQASAVITRVVPYERFCFHRVDPGTLLLTGSMARNLGPPSGYRQVIQNEYEQDDVNKWSSLAIAAVPVASIVAATAGRRERSARFQDILRPLGLSWELRAAFVSDRRCWGYAGIYRSDGECDFAPEETAFLASVSGMLGAGFRRALLVGELPAAERAQDGPGLVLLDARDEPLQVNLSAARLIEEMAGDGDPEMGWVPVYAVATRTRFAGGLEAHSRVRTPGGRWLTLHGTLLRNGGQTAVIIQPARPDEVAPLLLASYGLTRRECDVTGLLLRGRSTAEICLALGISPHTVQDHLKAIFEKTRVRSRRELVSRVFLEDHLPRIAAGEAVGADGAFV